MSSLGDANAILRGRTRTGKSRKKEKEGDPSISYICHICATDVPAAFSGAHDASKTHRANASIMAAASERMRAMVTARPPPRTARPVGTYCNVCNTMADSDHKKTATHKQAVRDEQLLSMLANLYCGGDDNDDDNVDDDDDDYDSADEISKSQEDTNDTTNAASQIDIEGAAHDVSPDKLSKSQDDTENNKELNDIKLNNTTNMASQIDIERANDNDDNSPDKLSEIQDVTDKNKNLKGVKVNNATNVNASKDNDDDDSPDKMSKSQNNTNPKQRFDASQHFYDFFGGSPFKDFDIDAETDNNIATGVISDPYDHKHDLFWSLVKRFKVEESYKKNRFIYITIHPVGSKIYVEKAKVYVSYDNFHSFNRKEGKCLVCMGYFDVHYCNEDQHIASKQHMSRIMLPVRDSDCFRKIADWFHCILCNDTFHINSEEQHKTSAEHCKNKLEAIPPSNQKSTFTANINSHLNVSDSQNVKIDDWFHCILCNDTFHINSEEQHKTSTEHCKNKLEATASSNQKSTSTANIDSHPNVSDSQNVKVQSTVHHNSSKNTETKPRKKITLQKQAVECTRKEFQTTYVRPFTWRSV